MAWCERCEAAWDDVSSDARPACPRCGDHPAGVDDADAGMGSSTGVPWHLKVLLVALVAYLGWRAVQGLLLLAGALG